MGTGLPDFRDDKVDMRLSHDGLVVSEPLNSKAKDPLPIDRCGSWRSCCLCPIPSGSLDVLTSGVESTVLAPPLKPAEDVSGRPAELRFRSLEVGADAAWGSGEGVAGMARSASRSPSGF